MLNLQKNYLEKYQQIYPENVEWNTLEYKLQLNLGNASAYLKRVYCVVNPYLNTQFEKDNKGHIISDVFVKPDELFGSNRIERVCQKGFEFPNNESGIQFTMGQIDMEPGEKAEQELLLVKVCPKKSYPCYQGDLDAKGCPLGFDSVYYHDRNEQKGLYRHRFRLYKKNQVLPMYVIQFGFNQEHERQFKQILCENCQDQTAKIYCDTEQVYFCKKCDYEHHKDRISARHQRNFLEDKPILDFGPCKNHRNNSNQLFCRVCNTSLCMSCKIYGDHAEGFMASHELFKIADYYTGATKKINEIEPNLDKRKYQLEQLLCFMDDQIDTINKKTSELQHQLKIMFEAALIKLESISKQKLSYIMSEQLEIRRQYDYIEWMESFLRYEKQVLPPNDFLMAWTKHEKLRKDVLNVSNIPGVTQVHPNIQIKGSIDVEENSRDKGDEEADGKKPYSVYLDKYAKSNGQKQDQDPNSVSNQFRKRLLFNGGD